MLEKVCFILFCLCLLVLNCCVLALMAQTVRHLKEANEKLQLLAWTAQKQDRKATISQSDIAPSPE